MAGLGRLRRLLVSRPASLLAGRSFGAVALQCDYDYYYDEEAEEEAEKRRRCGAGSRANQCHTAEGRGVQWVLMGNPGAQKHVYAPRLSRLLQVPHISMGSLVRQELNPRSSLYKQIANAVNEGRLVPEDVIFGLLSKRLEEGYYRGEMGFILDGIPRTRIQAEILDQIADVDLVVNLRCKEECLLNSNLGAGICSHCGQSSASDRSSDFCITNHQLKSSQANVDALREKFRVYAEESKPLEDYYKKQGKLLNFQVAGGLGETWQGLLTALHLQHMNGRSPSHKLTA